ncbi:MAG: carboxypeptidase regulatory-like domain-containing protein [Firmicutes bacterium]|nr:carboxypeptidase regulatory-like domain-containing protein [Bacillota bacterium]
MTQHLPPGRIHGRVVWAIDGQPVAGASVRVLDDGVVVDLQWTNAAGEFTSRLLFAGRYRIEAERDGARGATDGIAVELGRTTTAEIRVS